LDYWAAGSRGRLASVIPGSNYTDLQIGAVQIICTDASGPFGNFSRTGNSFLANVTVPDEAYGAAWNGSLEAPTKNALWDKIETLGSGGGGLTDGDKGDVLVGGGGTTMTVQGAHAAPFLVEGTIVTNGAGGGYLGFNKAGVEHAWISGDDTGLWLGGDSVFITNYNADATYATLDADGFTASGLVTSNMPGGGYVSLSDAGNETVALYGTPTAFYQLCHGQFILGDYDTETAWAVINSAGIDLPAGKVFSVAGVPIGGGGGGLTDGDKGDVVVASGGASLTVESSAAAFNVGNGQIYLKAGGPAGATQAYIYGSGGQVDLGAGSGTYFKNADGTVIFGKIDAGGSFVNNATGWGLRATPTTDQVYLSVDNGSVFGSDLILRSGRSVIMQTGTGAGVGSASEIGRFDNTGLTMVAGKAIKTAASAAASAGFNLPHGAAPSAPVNGDMWSTTAGIFARINGAIKTNAFTDSNITGSAGSVANAATFNNGGAGAASGASFNGSAAQTVSWNTIGAAPDAPRIQAVSSAASVTPTFSNDVVNVSAQAVNLTLAAPTGTAVDGKKIIVRIKAAGAGLTLTLNAIYRAIGVTIPATLTNAKWLYLGLVYSSGDTKWDIVALAQEA